MSRAISSACSSFSAKWSVTPEVRQWTSPPPSSSAVTISPALQAAVLDNAAVTFAKGNTLQNLRFTGESFESTLSDVRSDEIRSDRQVVDVVRVGVGSSGGFNFELSYGAHDDWYQAALQAASWSATVTAANPTTHSVVDTASVYTLHRSSGSYVTDGFTAQRWIKVTGFTTNGSTFFAKITAVAASDLTIVGLRLTGGVFLNEAAGASVTILQGGMIDNGTTLKTLIVEKQFLDLTTVFESFNGNGVDGFSLAIADQKKVTGSFSVIGKPAVGASATVGTGTNVATTTQDITNATAHVRSFFEGAVSAAGAIGFVDLSVQVKNNLRARTQCGTLGPVSEGSGFCEVTGNLKAYFSTVTLRDKFLNNTKSIAVVQLIDSNLKGYIIELFALRYSTNKNTAQAGNQDVFTDLSFKSFRDASAAAAADQKTIRITRFA